MARSTTGRNGNRRRQLGARVAMAMLVSWTSVFAQEIAPRTDPPLTRAVRGALALTPQPAASHISPFAVDRTDPIALTQSAAPSQGNWVSRHPILLGTAIGAGGAMALEAGSCGGRSCKLGTAGLVGAGIGAYTGLIVSAVQKAKRKEPVGTGRKIAIITGAIGGVAGAFLACYGAGGCGGVS